MRIVPMVALLSLFVSPLAFAGTTHNVAIAVDASSLRGKIASEVEDGMATYVLRGLAEVLTNLARTKVDLALVSEPRRLEQVRDCDGTTCLQDLARAERLVLVVQVRVQSRMASSRAAKKAKPDYAISMLVARDVPDRSAWHEEVDCQGCDAPEIKHMAYLLGSTVAERMNVETTPALAVAPVKTNPPPSTTPGPASSPSQTVVLMWPPPPAPARIVTRPVAETDPVWSVPRYVSLAVLAGGVVMLGTGIYLLHIQGEGTCDLVAPQQLCPRRYKTQSPGIGLLVGGGVAGLGGLVGLIFFSPKSGAAQMALNVTGSSISISGGF